MDKCINQSGLYFEVCCIFKHMRRDSDVQSAKYRLQALDSTEVATEQVIFVNNQAFAGFLRADL